MCGVKGCPHLSYCDQRTRNGYRVTLLHFVLMFLSQSTVQTKANQLSGLGKPLRLAYA